VCRVTTVLVLADIEPVDGPETAHSARMCAAISNRQPEPPLAIVAHGELALLLPAVALAQRSAHRRTIAYLLINPELPPVSDTWPDAPVTVASNDAASPAAVQGRLRGWTVITMEEIGDWTPTGDL
jgi:hypothetical protein